MSPTPEPSAESSPPRIWLRRGIGLGVLLVASVAAVVMVWRHLEAARVNQRIHHIQADLDATDPGWRWDDLVAKRPAPPTGKNSADVIAFVGRCLSAGWARQLHDVEINYVLPPNRLAPGERKLLATELGLLDQLVRSARSVADMPTGRHVWAEMTPSGAGVDPLENISKVAQLLHYDALRLADAGDLNGSLRSCRAAINCGRSLAEQPTTHRDRGDVVVAALQEVERMLSLGEASDPALAELQELLRVEEQSNDLLNEYRQLRAAAHSQFMSFLDRRLSAQQLLDQAGFVKPPEIDRKRRLFSSPRADIDHAYLVLMGILNRLVEAARLPPHEQRKALSGVAIALVDAEQRSFWVTALAPWDRLSLYQSGLYHGKLAAVQTMRVLIGVERYRLLNKRWPVRLADVPAALLPGGVSIDPFDGKPLRYRRTADGVVVYSVGEDCKDDGGAITDAGGRHRRPEPGADLGYRLWDLDKRRQPPLPAAPSKTEAP